MRTSLIFCFQGVFSCYEKKHPATFLSCVFYVLPKCKRSLFLNCFKSVLPINIFQGEKNRSFHLIYKCGYVTGFFTIFFTGGRSSFNWLTGSSIDTLAEYTVPSSFESMSSSMLFVNKRSEKFKQATFKPVGPDFGKKSLGLPGDEVDGKTKGL